MLAQGRNNNEITRTTCLMCLSVWEHKGNAVDEFSTGVLYLVQMYPAPFDSQGLVEPKEAEERNYI